MASEKIYKFVLLGDGTSDEALVPIVDMILRERFPAMPFFIDFTAAFDQGERDVLNKAKKALREFPCDLLIVHRDAERVAHQDRVNEIKAALTGLHVFVPLVPVRMLESWLLVDRGAIRKAAGNPNGMAAFDLPRIERIEGLADPKSTLHDALRNASGLSGRRLRGFDCGRAKAFISRSLGSLAPLRRLPSFVAFEQALLASVGALHTTARVA